MVRVVALAIVALVVSSCGIIKVNKHTDRQNAMAIACEYSPYNCGALATPKVVYEPMWPGLQGQYRGGDTIYINEDLSREERQEVLVHETIHYLQLKLGVLELPGWYVDICAAEEEAFRITDEWLEATGREDLMTGADWWEPYYSCYKWYNPDWTPRVYVYL